MDEKQIEIAIDFASRGLPITCLKRKKSEGSFKGYKKSATTDAAKIQELAKKYPDFNFIALLGGEFLNLEFDIKEGGQGISSYKKMMHDFGLPVAAELQTPAWYSGTGGLHTLWLTPARLKKYPKVKLSQTEFADLGFESTECLGAGNACVLPYSVHENKKTYEPLTDLSLPIAVLPDNIAACIETGLHGDKQKRDSSVKTVLLARTISKGERKVAMTRCAGLYRWESKTKGEALAHLRVDNLKCQPPLNDGQLVSICDSIFEYDTKIHFNASDSGNAETVQAYFGQYIRYCVEFKDFMFYADPLWERDGANRIRQVARDTARLQRRRVEMEYPEKGETYTKAMKYTLECESTVRINNAIKELATLCPVSADIFDADPMLLPVLNGVVDLETGKFRKAKDSDFLTMTAGVEYQEDAVCPTWDKFILRAMAGDEDKLRFIQRAVGYTATGSTAEKALFIPYGLPDSAKTSFQETVARVLCDFAQHSSPEILMVQKYGNAEGPTPAIAKLKGVRCLLTSETGKYRRLNAALVKNLTGQDKISARFLHENPFEFYPKFKIWMGTNFKPQLDAEDDACWRRVFLIPFNNPVPKDEQIKDLSEQMFREEGCGILNWIISGCLEWQSEGLDPPEEVVAATREYRNEMDDFQEYLDDCIEKVEGNKITNRALYESFATWTKDRGDKIVPQKYFTQKMRERGYKQGRSGKIGRFWEDIQLIGNL